MMQIYWMVLWFHVATDFLYTPALLLGDKRSDSRVEAQMEVQFKVPYPPQQVHHQSRAKDVFHQNDLLQSVGCTKVNNNSESDIISEFSIKEVEDLKETIFFYEESHDGSLGKSFLNFA